MDECEGRAPNIDHAQCAEAINVDQSKSKNPANDEPKKVNT